MADHIRLNMHAGLSIFGLLVAIYSLTYSGTFITDDEHILASRTLSLAFDGKINDSRVFGNSRVYALANSRGDYAAQGTNIEPAQAALGSVLASLSVWMGVGRVQTIFLLNIWATALTAVILFGIVLFLGYSQSVASVAALFFGLGTIVWPYTRSYFRDPLAMLFLTMAWGCTLVVSDQRNTFPKSKWLYGLTWLVLIAGVLAGILTKNTVILAVPVLVLYFLIAKYTDGMRISLKPALQVHWRKLVFSFAALLSWLILWIIFLTPDGIFARFTFTYYRSVMQSFIMRPHPGFLAALVGPIISPGKSIFIYSPMLLLFFQYRFNRWRLVWPACSYLLLLIAGQALFYDGDWPGHINWGLRFILPAIPLLVIASAPVIAGMLTSAKGRWGLLAIGSVSVFVQLAGVLAPIHQYYVELSSALPAVPLSASIWNIKYSPLLWHVKWITSGGALELAFVRVGLNSLPVVLGFLSIIRIILWEWTRSSNSRVPSLALILCMGLSVLMLCSYRNDPVHFRSRTDLSAAQEKILEGFSANDLVIVKSYGTPAWGYWMNWADADVHWISLPFSFPSPALMQQDKITHNPDGLLDEMTLSLLRSIPGAYNRVWIVLPSDSPGADLNLEVDWLEKRSTYSKSWSFSGNRAQTRLYLFELSSGSSP